MKQEWKHCSLGEALTFQRGFDITKKEQRDGPYKVISSSGPKSTHIDFKAKGPGVVIGRKGTLGSVFYTEEDYWPHDTSLWIKDFHGNDPKFAYYFLQTMGFEKLDVGAANPSLNRNHIHTIPVSYPDLPTQRKIAGILSAYDDLIENNLRRIKILEEMAQSLYREWFVHFRFPGHKSARFINSSLGQIPKGWNATMLGDFVDNKSVHLQTGPFGTQLKASHYSHEGTPVINVRNIGFGTLRAEKLEFLPPDKVDGLKRHQLRSGDIVFGRKGAVERHLLVGPVEDGWIQGSDCIRLRVVSGPLTPRFLSIGFREAEHQRWMMNQCSGGATMASLNQDILCRIPLAVPPPELIAKFDKFSTSAVDQVDVLASKIQTFRRTRNLLLPRLISSHSESNSNKNPV